MATEMTLGHLMTCSDVFEKLGRSTKVTPNWILEERNEARRKSLMDSYDKAIDYVNDVRKEDK